MPSFTGGFAPAGGEGRKVAAAWTGLFPPFGFFASLPRLPRPLAIVVLLTLYSIAERIVRLASVAAGGGQRPGTGADGTAEQRPTQNGTAGNGGDPGAGTGTKQSARDSPLPLSVAAPGQREAETGQEECRRNGAKHGVTFMC